MKRRDFIKQTAATSALLTVGSYGLSAFSSKDTKHITILHTNDVHSHIEPFKSTDTHYSNLGGIARRASLIEQVRQENPNTLLLDAGDIFQGTPYFNFFGGEIEFKMMSMLKYDAATIGNHDFDKGIEGLHKQLPHAKFDFIISNYDFKNTIMEGRTKPYRIIYKDGIKIGIFGLGIELDGLVDPKNFKETKYLNPIEIAQDMSTLLKEEKHCDLIICLSHLGYNYKINTHKISDLKLAPQTKNIDLIIGGHTHTFLKKPTLIKNLVNENMLINQVGWAGINVGRIDFYFDENTNKSTNGKSILLD